MPRGAAIGNGDASGSGFAISVASSRRQRLEKDSSLQGHGHKVASDALVWAEATQSVSKMTDGPLGRSSHGVISPRMESNGRRHADGNDNSGVRNVSEQGGHFGFTDEAYLRSPFPALLSDWVPGTKLYLTSCILEISRTQGLLTTRCLYYLMLLMRGSLQALASRLFWQGSPRSASCRQLLHARRRQSYLMITTSVSGRGYDPNLTGGDHSTISAKLCGSWVDSNFQHARPHAVNLESAIFQQHPTTHCETRELAARNGCITAPNPTSLWWCLWGQSGRIAGEGDPLLFGQYTSLSKHAPSVYVCACPRGHILYLGTATIIQQSRSQPSKLES